MISMKDSSGFNHEESNLFKACKVDGQALGSKIKVIDDSNFNKASEKVEELCSKLTKKELAIIFMKADQSFKTTYSKLQTISQVILGNTDESSE